MSNVMPVWAEISADLLTPVSAFLRLKGKQAFLFESVEGGERLGRYSFLGVNPIETLAIRNGQLEVKRGKVKKVLKGNPFEKLGEQISRYRGNPHPELPPFYGGAIGFVGYECVTFLENIPKPKNRVTDLDAYLMVFKTVLAFDHVKHRILIISNIFLDEENKTTGRKKALREIEQIKKILARPGPHEKGLEIGNIQSGEVPAHQMLGKKDFCNGVRKLKEHIRAGDIFQAVLSEQFELKLKSDPFQIYRVLRALSPAPYLYYISMDEGVLLGASPEMLVKVESRKVLSHPIAGTRARGKDVAEDEKFERHLLASVKEKAEHLMLVDLSRNDIGRIAKPGTVKVNRFMQVERFSHVMHLVSEVEGELAPKFKAWQALASCFPAGTLSGAPKIKAMELISEIETIQRGPYGGAIVYQGFSGMFDSCITIRSLFVKGSKGYVRAGAGIVADSQPEKEYEEVLNKSRALKRAIAISEDL